MAEHEVNIPIDPFEPIEENLHGISHELSAMPISYGYTLVHDRVFVTWFDHSPVQTDHDEFSFLAEPKYAELPADQAQEVIDLMNHQMDQMQALLQTFIEGDGTVDCADPEGPPGEAP